MEGKYERVPDEENVEEERRILEEPPIDEEKSLDDPIEESIEEEIVEEPIEEPIEEPVRPMRRPEPERVVEEIYVDYRDDVKEWQKDNNNEMEYLEEAVQGLLKAFRHSSDFYDGLRRIDAKTDIGRVFLELVTRFMGQYERADDTNFKSEVVQYIEANTSELEKIQERVNFLLKAYEYAEDFLYGLERIEPRNDISRAFVELLMKFVERGLSDE